MKRDRAESLKVGTIIRSQYGEFKVMKHLVTGRSGMKIKFAVRLLTLKIFINDGVYEVGKEFNCTYGSFHMSIMEIYKTPEKVNLRFLLKFK